MKIAKLIEPSKMGLFHKQNYANIADKYVLVKIHHVGICGSDLHYFRHGGLGSFKQDMPMEMGHEASGIVESSLSDKFNTGDRVAIEPLLSCGKCRYCLNGQRNLCDNRKFLGSNLPGALSEYLILHEKQLLKLPDETSLLEGMMLEPLTVALHAIRKSNMKIGDRVAIWGAGTIGILIGKLAMLHGADLIAIGDQTEERMVKGMLHANARFGLTDVWAGETEHHSFAEVVFECVGKQQTVDLSFKHTTKGGTVVLVGIPEVDYLTYNPHKIRTKELNIINIRNSNVHLEEALSLKINRDINLRGLITHRFPLDDVQEAFELASNYRDECIKVVIDL